MLIVGKVKMFVDFWNFQLRWKENMKPADPAKGPVSLAWERLPTVLMSELPNILGTDYPLTFRGVQIFASVNPKSGSNDDGLKRFLHRLNQETGFQVQVRDRRPKTESCPHCSGQTERMVEKGVDAAIVTALYEGAINDSYDIALLLSNDTDHIPAVQTIQDRLNKQIVHVGFKRGDTEVRTATWSHVLLDGPIAERMIS